jgi:hypothetical protein
MPPDEFSAFPFSNVNFKRQNRQRLPQAVGEKNSILAVFRPASALVAQSDGAVTILAKEPPTEAGYRSLSAHPPAPTCSLGTSIQEPTKAFSKIDSAEHARIPIT